MTTPVEQHLQTIWKHIDKQGIKNTLTYTPESHIITQIKTGNSFRGTHATWGQDNINQIEHWNQNRDPHAGRETHVCKSCQAFQKAIIHLLNIEIQNAIPTQGVKCIFATHHKKCRDMPRPWSAKTTKLNELYGNFQKTSFSSSLAAEVLKKTELALPRSTGSTKQNAPHRAWGLHFCFLQPLQRENATHNQQDWCAPLPKLKFVDSRNSNITVEGLQQLDKIQTYYNM